jgi:hypothetical protein
LCNVRDSFVKVGKKPNEIGRCDVYYSMNTPSWSATLRLATIVSVVAAVAVVLLASLVPETLLIGSVIAVSSLIGWLNAEGMLRPLPVRIRRR